MFASMFSDKWKREKRHGKEILDRFVNSPKSRQAPNSIFLLEQNWKKERWEKMSRIKRKWVRLHEREKGQTVSEIWPTLKTSIANRGLIVVIGIISGPKKKKRKIIGKESWRSVSEPPCHVPDTRSEHTVLLTTLTFNLSGMLKTTLNYWVLAAQVILYVATCIHPNSVSYYLLC